MSKKKQEGMKKSLEMLIDSVSDNPCIMISATDDDGQSFSAIHGDTGNIAKAIFSAIHSDNRQVSADLYYIVRTVAFNLLFNDKSAYGRIFAEELMHIIENGGRELKNPDGANVVPLNPSKP